MNMERHITQKPIFTPWLMAMSYPVCIAVLCLMERPGFLAAVVCIAITVLLLTSLDRFCFDGDIILTADGVETTCRVGKRKLAWKAFCQIGAMREDGTDILVLVRLGGKPMGEKTLPLWFFLRNIGKVIYLPDDQFTRAYVAKYYGPLDFDRNAPEK